MLIGLLLTSDKCSRASGRLLAACCACCALFQMRNADWLIIDIRQMFTCKWQTVVPDVICVRSTKYQLQVLFCVMKQFTVIKL